jgi:hypothetical protein
VNAKADMDVVRSRKSRSLNRVIRNNPMFTDVRVPEMQRRPLHEPNREMKLLGILKGRLSLMRVVRLEKSLIW